MAFLGTTIAKACHRQRAARQRTLVKAHIWSDLLPTQSVVIRNISRTGLGLATHGVKPRVDEDIMIECSNKVTMMGRVAWVEGMNFGVELSEEVNVADFIAATRRQNDIISKSTSWCVEERYIQREVEPSGFRPCYL